MKGKDKFIKEQLARLAEFGEKVLEQTDAKAAEMRSADTYPFQTGAYKAAVHHMTDQLKAFAKIIK